MKRLNQKQIRDLSETYLTLGFKEIGEKAKTNVAEVEQNIKEMIAEGLVSARMDMRNQTVEFIETEGADSIQNNQGTIKLIETLEKHNQRIGNTDANKTEPCTA